MSRKRTIKSLDQAFKIQEAAKGQVTAQQLINERMNLPRLGWSNVIVSDELLEEVAEQVSQMFGGRYTTRAAMKRTLLNERPQHWGLDRIFVEKYGKGPAVLKYCAGQDRLTEEPTIRKALK